MYIFSDSQIHPERYSDNPDICSTPLPPQNRLRGRGAGFLGPLPASECHALPTLARGGLSDAWGSWVPSQSPSVTPCPPWPGVGSAKPRVLGSLPSQRVSRPTHPGQGWAQRHIKRIKITVCAILYSYVTITYARMYAPMYAHVRARVYLHMYSVGLRGRNL